MVRWVTRLTHGGQELNVDNICKLPRFLQTVKSFHIDRLSNDFIRDLIAPLVDLREVDVVDEDYHFLTVAGAEGVTHALLHVALDCFLREMAIQFLQT